MRSRGSAEVTPMADRRNLTWSATTSRSNSSPGLEESLPESGLSSVLAWQATFPLPASSARFPAQPAAGRAGSEAAESD